MELFSAFLSSKKKTMKKQGIKLLVTGSKEGVSNSLLKKIEETEKYLENEETIVFNIAFNYGGRKEITDAINKILSDEKIYRYR